MSKDQSSPTPLMLFTAAAPVLVDGDFAKLRCNVNGALLVDASGGGGGSVSRFDSGADVRDAVIKAAAGQLLQITAFNASLLRENYLHIFDLAAVPAPGAVPDWVAPPVNEEQTVSHDWGDVGLPMTTGITVGVSTTRTTFTPGAPDMWISARFI